MKGPIKSVLAEELENSMRMRKEYEKALEKIPKGCLSKKNIKGINYYYVAKREGSKVIYEYKGKLSKEQIKKIKSNAELRAKYRGSLSKVKRQIRFLKGCLRGKEPI